MRIAAKEGLARVARPRVEVILDAVTIAAHHAARLRQFANCLLRQERHSAHAVKNAIRDAIEDELKDETARH